MHRSHEGKIMEIGNFALLITAAIAVAACCALHNDIAKLWERFKKEHQDKRPVI